VGNPLILIVILSYQERALSGWSIKTGLGRFDMECHVQPESRGDGMTVEGGRGDTL
jgi:hypothetical protein